MILSGVGSLPPAVRGLRDDFEAGTFWLFLVWSNKKPREGAEVKSYAWWMCYSLDYFALMSSFILEGKQKETRYASGRLSLMAVGLGFLDHLLGGLAGDDLLDGGGLRGGLFRLGFGGGLIRHFIRGVLGDGDALGAARGNGDANHAIEVGVRDAILGGVVPDVAAHEALLQLFVLDGRQIEEDAIDGRRIVRQTEAVIGHDAGVGAAFAADAGSTLVLADFADLIARQHLGTLRLTIPYDH